MNRTQRGFGLPELVVGLLIVGMVSGLVYAVHGWWTGFTEDLREEGRVEVRLQVSQRDNEKLKAATERIAQLEADARAREAGQAKEIAGAVAKHIKEKNDANAKLETLRAAVRDGSLLLRDPGAQGGAGCPGGGERAGPAAAGDPAGGAGPDGRAGLPGEPVRLLPGAGGGALSAQASDFHVVEAARANAILGKLELCRATLSAERQPPPR